MSNNNDIPKVSSPSEIKSSDSKTGSAGSKATTTSQQTSDKARKPSRAKESTVKADSRKSEQRDPFQIGRRVWPD